MAEKTMKKHAWEFTRFFRAGVFKWNGTALASKRIHAAIREIKQVAKKDSCSAAQGAVNFVEKCGRAIEHIDSSSGAIGNAVNSALYEVAAIIGTAELTSKDRLSLVERIWESWEEEECGYYDVLSELWPKFCREPEIMTYWADRFLPIVTLVFKSTEAGAYFKGSEPCLACLFETGRYDEVIDILQNKERILFDYLQYVIKVAAAKGDLDAALKMVDEYMCDPYISPYAVARLGEELLMQSGRIEEAYRKYAFRLPFQTTGLATFTTIHKRYPKISPQRIINDLLANDPGNERRYFAAARKIGMIELAIEIAEKYDVEPKTLTTASKDYVEKDPDLSLRFGLLALQRYANGYGYEPEYADVQKCHDSVCTAAVNAGKKDEVTGKVRVLAENDKSVRKLVALVVGSGQKYRNTIVPVRLRA